MFQRERTRYEVIYYAVYLVFQGLSFQGAVNAIEPFVGRTKKAVWDWCKDLGSDKGFLKLFKLGRRRVKVFAIDETGIRIDRFQAYLFVAYEPFEERILGLFLAWNSNSIVVEMFLKDLIKKYGKHQVWTDGAEWYSLACKSIGLKHHTYKPRHWLYEVMERTIQKLKDRTESFDDMFPCRSQGLRCRLKHIGIGSMYSG